LQSISKDYKELQKGYRLSSQENGSYSLVRTSRGHQFSQQVSAQALNISTVNDQLTTNISYLYATNREENIKAKVSEGELTVLLDTGALTDNFVSNKILKEKLPNVLLHKLNENKYVKSIHGTEKLNHFILIKPQLITPNARFDFPNDIIFLVIDKGPADLTIGLHDIRKYDLTVKLRSHFAPTKAMEESRSTNSGQWASLQAQSLQAQPLPITAQIDNSHIYKTISKDFFLDPLPTTDPIDELVEEDPWSSYFNETNTCSVSSLRKIPVTQPPQKCIHWGKINAKLNNKK
jgi:hypothetical protein